MANLNTRYNESGYRQFEENGEWVYTHHRVAEKKLDREIQPGEQVHHINKVKTDNRPENLVVLPTAVHERVHQSEWHERNVCFSCGRTGHWASECYARTDYQGNYMKKNYNNSYYGSGYSYGGYRRYNSYY